MLFRNDRRLDGPRDALRARVVGKFKLGRATKATGLFFIGAANHRASSKLGSRRGGVLVDLLAGLRLVVTTAVHPAVFVPSGAGSDHPENEVGHFDFDVELRDVGERGELNIALLMVSKVFDE